MQGTEKLGLSCPGRAPGDPGIGEIIPLAEYLISLLIQPSQSSTTFISSSPFLSLGLFV